MNFIFKLIIIVFFTCNAFSSELIIAFDKSSILNQNEPTAQQQIDIDKIKKVAKQKNINVKFKAIPWKRALLMLEKGLLDGAMNASYNDARATFSVYPMNGTKVDSSKRLNDGNTYYIYRHKDSTLRWNGKVFLNGGKIGVKEKYAVINDLKKHKNIIIEEFVKNSELVRKLSMNKLDGYAGSYEEANILIKKYVKFSKSIIQEPLPIRKKEYFLIFSKKRYAQKSKAMEEIWSGFKQFNHTNIKPNEGQ